MNRRITLWSVFVCLIAAAAEAAPLPVIFMADDFNDNDPNWEAVSQAVVDLHVTENVPLVMGVIPCKIDSTPDDCQSGTYHENYPQWLAEHRAMLEAAQHGFTHLEDLDEHSRDEQMAMLSSGLEEMKTWGLHKKAKKSRPFAFSPVFAQANDDTRSVMEELGFRTFLKDSGDCITSDKLDVFCLSVPLCELDSEGNRVDGPSCVLRSPEELVVEAKSREDEGKIFLAYHIQDFLLEDRKTVDDAKVDGLRAILQAFRDEEVAGSFDLMTASTYYAQTHCGGKRVTIPGTSGPDALVGTAGDDVIQGLGGNDQIDGKGGNDVVCGGGGHDVLKGGGGNDVLIGSAGNDVLQGGRGTDTCKPGGGSDSVSGCE